MQSYEETVAFESSNEDADDRDRRQHHREGVSLAVRLEGDNRLLAGNTENVSVGGIFVGTPEEFELGTLVHVVCELPGGDVVEADGMVTWSRPALPGRAAGVGVEFIALSPDDRKRLEAVPGVTT
jgi:uncharacterized protein (TIGR02266 family)